MISALTDPHAIMFLVGAGAMLLALILCAVAEDYLPDSTGEPK